MPSDDLESELRRFQEKLQDLGMIARYDPAMAEQTRGDELEEILDRHFGPEGDDGN